MILKNIKMQNFRNYESLDVDFFSGVNIIYGKNAQGKTNLLESIYVLGNTKSHRSFIDNNLIMKDRIQARITGTIEKDNIDTNYDIVLTENNKNLAKKLFIDKQEIKKVSNYISNINIIIFYPEDLEIIKGSPNDKRKFLNSELSSLYNNYYRVLFDYNYLLKKRNECLKKMNINNLSEKIYFDKLTEHLINKAIFLYRARSKFVEKLNLYCGKIYKKIMKMNDFHVVYKPCIEINDFSTEYLTNKLKEEYKNNFEKEKILGSTLVGPHRDDLEFYLGEKDVKFYCSQGQTRAAVIALKLSEIEIFKKQCKTMPILLLDDVFSELDMFKNNNLLKYIDNNIQTIITTTDLNNINDEIIKKSKIFEISKGSIKQKRRGGTNGKQRKEI